MNTKTYIVCIQGRAPLLMHRFADDGEEELESTTRKVHVKKQSRRQAAEAVAYRNAKGELYIPGAAIKRNLREAAASHKQRGSRKSMKYVIPSAVRVPQDQIVLRDAEGKALTHYEVDSRPVVIPSTKGRVMRHRPRIDAPWWAEFHIEIDDDEIEPMLVHQIMNEGLQKLGLLDYRPEKGGDMGLSTIVDWNELAQTVSAKLAAD